MKIISPAMVLVCALFLPGGMGAAPLEGAMLIAHAGAPPDGLSAAALKDIYTGKTTYWPNGEPVVIVLLPNVTDAALKEICGMDSSQFKTFWQRMVFSGRGQQPKKAEDPAALVALVASINGAIALMPTATPPPGLKVIEIK